MQRRCVIISAYNNSTIRASIALRENDFILCADGGYALAVKEGVKPDLLIGDFDSMAAPASPDCELIRLPVHKDDTDTMACVRYAIGRGFSEIAIVGGMGGRFDHSIASIQTLAYAQSHGADAVLADGDTTVFFVADAARTVARIPGRKLSVFSYTETCTGVTLRGVEYPLTDAVLTQNFPIGVSNEFTADFAEISVQSGVLLIVLSADN